MSQYQKQIPVTELQHGMYVCKLDCAWHNTPFPLQGFHIRTQQDIDQVKAYCKHVFIDITRTRDPETYRRNAGQAPTQQHRANVDTPLVARPVRYPQPVSIKKELKEAKVIYADLNRSIHQLQEQLLNSTQVDLQSPMEVSRRVVQSVIRNPDALIWVVKLKQNAASLYQHTINCAVWAAVLGREIGLPEKSLEQLTTGVLLSKIGLMFMVRDQTVDHVRLRSTESYQKHVLYAIKLLGPQDGLSRTVLEIIATHEERYDGSGFPSALEGEQIPLFGQIAGLVDYYESSTNPLFCESPMSPTDALGHLYQLRNAQFSERLTQAFIQTLGLYPPGTIVELNTAEVGIVTSNRREQRLQPEILVVLNHQKQRLRSTRTMDLQKRNRENPSEPIEIVSALPLGAFGIEPHRFQYAHDSLISRLLG